MENLAPLIQSLARAKEKPPPEFYAGLLPGVWKAAVGETLAAVTRPGRIQDGKLTVYTASRLWNSQLVSMAGPFLRRLNVFVPADIVHGVVFRVFTAPFKSSGRKRTRFGQEEMHEITVCSAGIADARLREAFTRARLAWLAREKEWAGDEE